MNNKGISLRQNNSKVQSEKMVRKEEIDTTNIYTHDRSL